MSSARRKASHEKLRQFLELHKASEIHTIFSPMPRCSLKILLLCLAWLCQAASLFGQVFIDGPEEVRAGEEFTFRALEQLPDGTTKDVSPSRYTISVRYSGSNRFESLQVGRGYQIPDGHPAVDFGSGSSWAYSGWFDGFTKDFTLNISITGSQTASKIITFRTGYLPPPWDSLRIEGPSVLPVGNDLTGNKGEFRLIARVAGGQEQDVSSYAEWKVMKGIADVSAEYSKPSRLLTVRETSFTPGGGRLLEVKYPGASTLTKQVGFEAAASPKKFTSMEVLLEQKAPAPAVVKPKPGAKPKPRPVVAKPTKPTFQPLPVAAGESLKLTENQQARFRVRVWYDDGSFRYLESTYASSATAQDPYFFEWLQQTYDYRAPYFIDKRASTGVLKIGVWMPGFDTFTLGLNAYDPYKAHWTGSGAIQWNQPIRIVPAVTPVSLKITNPPQVAVLDENTSWSFGAVAMMSDGSQQDVRSLTTFTPSDGNAAVFDPNVRGKIYLKPIEADLEITLFASANVLGKALQTNIPLVVHDRGPDLTWPDPPVYSKLFSHTDGQSLTAGTFVQFRVEEALGVTTQVMVGSRFGYPDILNDVVPWNRNVGSLIQIPDQARDLWVSVRSLRYGSVIHEENYRLPIIGPVAGAGLQGPQESTTGFRLVQNSVLGVMVSADENTPHSSAPEEKIHGLRSGRELARSAQVRAFRGYDPGSYGGVESIAAVQFVFEMALLDQAYPELAGKILTPDGLFDFFGQFLAARGVGDKTHLMQPGYTALSIPEGALTFYLEPSIGSISWKVRSHASRNMIISRRAFGDLGICDGNGNVWNLTDGIHIDTDPLWNLYSPWINGDAGQFIWGWITAEDFQKYFTPELVNAYAQNGNEQWRLNQRITWAKQHTQQPPAPVVRQTRQFSSVEEISAYLRQNVLPVLRAVLTASGGNSAAAEFQRGKREYQWMTNGTFSVANLERVQTALDETNAAVLLLAGDYAANRDAVNYLNGRAQAISDELSAIIEDGNAFVFVSVLVIKEMSGYNDLQTVLDSDASFRQRAMSLLFVLPVGKIVKGGKVVRNIDELDDLRKMKWIASPGGLLVERYIVEKWEKGTFGDAVQSLEYHFRYHGNGRTVAQYTEDAVRFWETNKQQAVWGQWDPRWASSFRLKVGNQFGYYTLDGKILTYGENL